MKQRVLELRNHPKVSNWLDECRTLNTRSAYLYAMANFFAWYGDSVESFLALSKYDKRHIALKYQNEKMGILSNNTISMTLGTINSFLDQFDQKINFKGKKVTGQMDLSSHVFNNGDLRKIFEIGNVKEKALIALMSSTGWEIGAVLGLKRKKIQEIVNRAKDENKKFWYFIDQRKKTGAVRLGILNPLCLKWLDKWLVESKDIPLRKRDPNRSARHIESDIFDISVSGSNQMIKGLVKKANLKTTGRCHPHLVRKWVMGNLVAGGFSEWETKFVVGKKIPTSDFTYLKSLEIGIQEKYPAIFENRLNLETSSKAVIELSKSLEEKDKEIKTQKIQLDKLQEKYLSLQKRINGLSKIRGTSDLLMREILNDPRFQKLLFDKVAEHGGMLEVREDVTVNGKADVNIHSLGKEDVKKALRP